VCVSVSVVFIILFIGCGPLSAYVNICIYINIYIYIYIYVYVYTCVYTYITWSFAKVSKITVTKLAGLFPQTYVYAYIYKYIHIYIYMHVHVYVKSREALQKSAKSMWENIYSKSQLAIWFTFKKKHTTNFGG